MSITYGMAELLELLVLDPPQIPYWIEIQTENPSCIYYFGHFNCLLSAKLMKQGYIQDLIDELAIVVSVKIKQCQPEKLTVLENNEDRDSSRSL